MSSTNKNCISKQLSRYLRFPSIKNDPQLSKLIYQHLGNQLEIKQPKNRDEPQLIKPQIISVSSSPVVSQKQKIHSVQSKQSSNEIQIGVQKREAPDIPLLIEVEENPINFTINKNIIEVMEKNELVLLGTQTETVESPVVCGFMVVEGGEFGGGEMEKIHEAFATEQRKITGIGIRVDGNLITKSDIELVRSFVGYEGFILILNAKTKTLSLLQLTEQQNIKNESFAIPTKINYLQKSFYFYQPLSTLQVQKLITPIQNIKTKQIQLKVNHQISTNNPIKPIGPNIYTTLNLKFAKQFSSVVAKTNKGNYWGYIIFPQLQSKQLAIVSKFKTMKELSTMESFIKTSESKNIIPVEKFGHPIGKISVEFLGILYENKIEFFGFQNKRQHINFFMLVGQPNEKETYDVKVLMEGNGSKEVQYIRSYVDNSEEDQGVSPENVEDEK